METSKKVLFKCDRNGLKENDELNGVVFNEPRLVAFKEESYDILKPAKKIFYFKEPKPHRYPIDLNLGYCTYTEKLPPFGLNATLQYVMSSSGSEDAKKIAENVDKIKIFTRRGNLIGLMENFYPQRYRKCRAFRVTRYNEDLYMTAKRDNNEDPVKPYNSHDGQFLKNVFTESFYNEPNTDEPFDANEGLLGVFQSSFGEFELIYSSPIYGIQAEDEFKDL
ncbi:hypothetical protein DOY81_009348 [Sarcophaga bullata]|nr:hypothetical protein DOY81_009348 [Sarcophaga bullata]